MDSVKKYKELPTAWVNIWVGIGVGAIVFFVIALLILGVLMNAEMIRMEECEAGIREDCNVSLIWALKGYSGLEEVTQEDQESLKKEAEEKLALEYERGVRYYQASVRAPKVAGVEMRGTDYDENWFSAEAGTEIEVIIRPEGVYERAALYVHPKVSPTPGVGFYEGEMTEREDGTFFGIYRVPIGLEADLEARVINSSADYGSAFIQLRSK